MTSGRAGAATTHALLAEAQRTLAGSGLPNARQDAECLLADLAGIDRGRLYVDPPVLAPGVIEAFQRRVARRASHEPLQHILGAEEFCGLSVAVSPAVLIPRPETEALVEWAVALMPDSGTVLDIGTGSACIACAVARRRPGARVIAVDSAQDAIAAAAANAVALGVSDRVWFVVGDLVTPFRPARVVDVIVANLPYCPTATLPALPREVIAFEPRGALDGGEDGTRLQRRLIREAGALLRPGGWIVMEIGEEQAGPLAGELADAGFVDVQVRRDFRGVERYVGARSVGAAAGVTAPSAAAPTAGAEFARDLGVNGRG